MYISKYFSSAKLHHHWLPTLVPNFTHKCHHGVKKIQSALYPLKSVFLDLARQIRAIIGKYRPDNSKGSRWLWYCNLEYVDERHRHRYEVNPEMVGILEEAGLKFVGKDESGQRMEILELPNHPFYVGVQFHPEFKSRPGRPSAPFLGLILAATGQLGTYLSEQQNGSL